MASNKGTSTRIAPVAKAGKRAGPKPGKLSHTMRPGSNIPASSAPVLSNFRVTIDQFSDPGMVQEFRRSFHRASGNKGFANPDICVA